MMAMLVVLLVVKNMVVVVVVMLFMCVQLMSTPCACAPDVFVGPM